MKTILLIEDDFTLRMGMEEALRQESFSVLPAENIENAKRLLNKHPDLVLLDLNLPDGDGLSICKEIKNNYDIPIIFLTVRDDESDIIKGLDMGGDDYITKPFRLPVLMSRIRAVLRRYAQPRPERDVLTCGGIALIQSGTRVRVNHEDISLTAGEYKLLLSLLLNKNRTLTRGRLLELLWDESGNFVNDNTLTVTMKRLREKLGDNASRAIKTIRGIGYTAVDIDDE